MKLVKGDLLKLSGQAEHLLGSIAYFEKFWNRGKGCDISLFIPQKSVNPIDQFVFCHEYFPIGSKE